MILSDAEVAVLTRRTRYTAQRRALGAIGVPYRRYNCRDAAFCCAGAHLDVVRRQYKRAER